MDKRNYSLITIISFFSFLPRYLIAWWAVLTYCTLIMIIMIGTSEHIPMEAWRYKIVAYTVKPFARIHMWMSGIIKVNYKERPDICYKKYLGDDWRPTFHGAGIQISNH